MRRLALACAFALLPSWGCDRAPDPDADASEAAARASWRPGDDAPVEDVTEARTGLLRRGSTLQRALGEVGLETPEALKLAAAVDDVWPVRSLRVGTPFTLSVTRFGEPVAFDIWPDAVEGVEAVKNGGVWEAQAARRNLARHVRFLTGLVETSFYESIVAAGGDAELVVLVSDILQWDVDFFIDPRAGDRYSILVETWADGSEIVRYGDILAIEYDGEHASAEAFRYLGADGTGYYTAGGESVQRTLLKSPLNFRRISSHFSHRRFHPILRRYRPHLGVDYAADAGTPVVTIGDGKVVFAGTRGGYGRLVVVRHNARLTTQYAHLSRFGKGVRSGAQVTQGQVIGYVGSTGLSTGPHLDFRCKVNDAFVNPLTLERPPADPVPESERDAFAATAERYRRACRELGRSGFVPMDVFEASFMSRGGAPRATHAAGLGDGPG